MSNKLYVGNLSYNATEESLKNAFEQCGSVASCRIVSDRDTGRSKGFGFIEMSSADEAQSAISQLDGAEFEGRNLKVNEAKPQENNRNSGRNRW